PDAGRAAVAATREDHTDRAPHLTNVGEALRARFERVGDLADINEAVVIGRAAVAATPTDHPDQTKYLRSLGKALQARFERVGDPANANEALNAWRGAAMVSNAPPTGRSAR